MSTSPTTRPVSSSPAKAGFKKLFAIFAGITGVGFGGVAYDITVNGTGARVPTGSGAIEGTLVASELVEVPAGDPVLFGEVRLTQPGSGAVDHSWSMPVGEARQRVLTADGEVEVVLPSAREWKGPVQPDHRQVESVEGLAVISEADDVASRLGAPPYQVLVTAFRPGDPVVARRADDGTLSQVYPGERAELESWVSTQESRRWPIVGLLAVMCFASLMLSWRSWK